MIVSAIKAQVRNKDRVNIFVDDKYGFSLTLDELLSEHLTVGLEIDVARLKKLKKISSDGKIKHKALEWVLNRPRSEKEFERYIFKRNIDKNFGSSLLNIFVNKGYINNLRFTEWLVDLRLRSDKSNRRIIGELKDHGILNHDIEAVMTTRATEESDRIKNVIAKKSKLTKYKSNPSKLIVYLVSVGFSYQDSKEEIDNILK